MPGSLLGIGGISPRCSVSGALGVDVGVVVMLGVQAV